jgi:hypothetical protein
VYTLYLGDSDLKGHTQNGYIHVSLREVEPEGEQAGSDKVILELSVLDTGKVGAGRLGV